MRCGGHSRESAPHRSRPDGFCLTKTHREHIKNIDRLPLNKSALSSEASQSVSANVAMRSTSIPLPRISEQIWEMKYRLEAADGSALDRTIADTWARVAKAAAAVEHKRVRER